MFDTGKKLNMDVLHIYDKEYNQRTGDKFKRSLISTPLPMVSKWKTFLQETFVSTHSFADLLLGATSLTFFI